MRRAAPFALLAVLGIASLGAGCDGRLSPQAQRLLDDVRQAASAGDSATVIRQSDAFLVSHGDTAAAGEVYYLRGRAKMRQGGAAGAKSDLQEAVRLADTDALKAKALNSLGDLDYDAGSTDQAVQSYQAALALQVRPPPPGTDRALYRMGEHLQKQGQWAEADERFDRLAFLYRNSELSREASERVRSRAWTVVCGGFADRQEAEKLAEAVREAGKPADVRAVLVGNRPEFRVQSGRYGTYDQALPALADIRREMPHAHVSPTR